MKLPLRNEEIGRLKTVIRILKKYEGDFLVHELQLKHLLPSKKKPSGKPKTFYQPTRIRKILEELGGSFVKLGQLLSLRPDLLQKDYIDELSKLQDNVNPIAFAKIKRLVESELNGSIAKLFKTFNSKPLSSASVSQVHRATLKDGTEVVVKVQRSDIARNFKQDISILAFLAGLAEKYLDMELVSPVEFVEEFKQYTARELDFLREAKNIDRFYEYFKDDERIVIPKVEWDLSTKKVLTMTYIEGIPIKKGSALKKAGLDPDTIATNLAHSIYTQILIWGVFHADPHPGNVLALQGNRIGLLDYGIVGRFTPTMQRHLREIFIALLTGDIDGIGQGLLMLKVLTPESDPEQFKRDMLEHMAQFYDLSLEHIKLSDFVIEMVQVMKKNRLHVPRDLILLGKALLTLEGTCHVLDPEFNPVTVGRSFISEVIKYERSPKRLLKGIIRDTMRLKNFIVNLPEQTREVIDVLRKADDYIASVNNTIKLLTLEVDRVTNRVTKGILMAAMILAGSFMIGANIRPVWGMSLPSFICFFLAGLIGLNLLISAIREQRFVKKLFSEKFLRKFFKRF